MRAIGTRVRVMVQTPCSRSTSRSPISYRQRRQRIQGTKRTLTTPRMRAIAAGATARSRDMSVVATRRAVRPRPIAKNTMDWTPSAIRQRRRARGSRCSRGGGDGMPTVLPPCGRNGRAYRWRSRGRARTRLYGRIEVRKLCRRGRYRSRVEAKGSARRMSEPEQINESPPAPATAEGNGEAPERKKVAVIFAHPDDPDFSCAGTVARWTDEGHEVVYVLLTNGDKGSHDPEMSPERLVKIREEEQRAAAAVVGVNEVIFLGRPDGLLVADLELRRDVVRVIRQIKPTTVVCGDPTVYWHAPWYINHPDHRAAGEVVLAALYP